MHQWHRVVVRPGANGADISTGSCYDPVPELFLHRVIKRTGTKCLRMSTGGKKSPGTDVLARLDISECWPSSLSLSLSSLCPSHFSFLLSFLLLQHGAACRSFSSGGWIRPERRGPDPLHWCCARGSVAGLLPGLLCLSSPRRGARRCRTSSATAVEEGRGHDSQSLPPPLARAQGHGGGGVRCPPSRGVGGADQIQALPAAAARRGRVPAPP